MLEKVGKVEFLPFGVGIFTFTVYWCFKGQDKTRFGDAGIEWNC